MKRPYVICYMMTSIDGRIDCAMTSHLPGEEYYEILESLNTPTHFSGRVTAELEMALPGKFESDTYTKVEKESFSKAREAKGYEVIIDTKGTLLWNDNKNEEDALLIVTSLEVSKEYLDYLDSKHISWICTGEKHVNLPRALEILSEEFQVERMAVVGGGHINAGFLQEDLLDEIILLIGAGIDGRSGMASVFDGLPIDTPVKVVKLNGVTTYDSGAVLIRYIVA